MNPLVYSTNDNNQRKNDDKYPLFRNITENFMVHQETARLKLTFDSNVQIYLKDHVFGIHLFVPATMIMELFFEAALFYTEFRLGYDIEKYQPSQLNDFFIFRSIVMPPGGSAEIELIYKKIIQQNEEILLEIDITSQRINKSNILLGNRLNATAQVILSSKSPPSPEFQIPQSHFKYYRLPKEKYYAYYFPSLGPLFQSSNAYFAVAHDYSHLIGEYDCLNKEFHFIMNQQSSFVTSPLGNDTCLQYAVFFSRIINLIGRLPVGGKKLTFYRKHPSCGKVKVWIECLYIDQDVMVSNMTSFDCLGSIFNAQEFTVKKSPYHKVMTRQSFDQVLGQHQCDHFEW